MPLAGTIAAYSYFLLERTDDSTIADLAANQIYTGSLSNAGERLELLGPSGSIIDTANASGGAWPAGDHGSRASMERRGGSDIPGNWGTFSGFGGIGHDSDGNPIAGTPRQLNSILLATPTPTVSLSPTPYPLQSIVINEIAWSGSLASASDEWIELLNLTDIGIPLAGWVLSDGADINIALTGTLPANSFYLLERTDDTTISDITANQIYTGSLSNGGEHLRLLDPSGTLVDSVTASGGWPAGDSTTRSSMERGSGWGTFTGYFGNGLDAAGNPIRGTPRRPNSLLFPTPTPTAVPSRIVINEVLIRPRYDWEGTGGVTTADEFIELYNAGPLPVYLKGWFLDDVSGSGSKPYDLPGVTISPRGYAVFFRSKTKIALNDTGDTVRLLAPNGRVLDQISYLKIRAVNLSYGRFPDGSDNMRYGLWPTPRMPNLPFVELAESETETFFPRLCAGRVIARLSRAARGSAQVAWLREMHLVGCAALDQGL